MRRHGIPRFEWPDPRGASDQQSRRRFTLLCIAVAVLALLVKLYIAGTTVGTNDVMTWQHFADQVRTIGLAELYRRERDFNHPPLIGQLLRVIGWLGVHARLPFPLWLRLPAIIADLLTFIMVVRLVGPMLPVLLLAACPPLIMISGFHGNTDPVMIMWLMLAVWLVERAPVSPRSAASAGVAVALAINTKIVPVVLLPAFVLWLPTWRTRVSFVACLGGAAVVASLPVLLQAPRELMRNVLDYKSVYGQWGIARLLSVVRVLVFPRPQWVAFMDQGFETYGRLIDAGAVLVVASWMNLPGRHKPALFVQCGLTLLVFLALSPGFGVQYLAWIMPWSVAAGLRGSIFVYTASTMFLASVYTYWSGQWPWYYANSMAVSGWNFRLDIIALELLTWCAVVGTALMLVSSIRTSRREEA